ncbi:MAG TPA: DUF1844 domain-containing protein [Verrucomicrobiae bacterium]|nr:DUF1844 domain-containing protein [Verrucomicrobiae bacterium]
MSQANPDDLPDQMSASFAQFVVMQSQNILFALGRLAGPEGATEPHFDVARALIDQLEMIQHKTRGNLSPDETKLLENALSNMRLAFVETVNLSAAPTSSSPESQADKPPSPNAGTDEEEKTGDGDEDGGERKRFSKSYG